MKKSTKREVKNTTQKKEVCKHKWLPNGVITTTDRYMFDVIISSCVCEKCGKMETKEESL